MYEQNTLGKVRRACNCYIRYLSCTNKIHVGKYDVSATVRFAIFPNWTITSKPKKICCVDLFAQCDKPSIGFCDLYSANGMDFDKFISKYMFKIY